MGEDGGQSDRPVRDGRVGPTITPKKQGKHRYIEIIHYGRKISRAVKDEQKGCLSPTITGQEQRRHRCIDKKIKCICGSPIVVETGWKELIIKARILRADKTSNEVSAKCANCKRWVKVPLICTA